MANILIYEGILKKLSYERHGYESVQARGAFLIDAFYITKNDEKII